MIVDGHLDLAYNVIAFRRNICHELDDIRKVDASDTPGTAVVCLPELRKAGVRICFGTVFVTRATPKSNLSEYQVLYSSPQEAFEKGMAQLNYYRTLETNSPFDEECGKVRIVTDSEILRETLEEKDTIGIVPLMEGAGPIKDPDELSLWYSKGLRIVGPAWEKTQYANSAWSDKGGFTPLGFELLKKMERLNMILDVSHLSETAVDEALDVFEGAIIASHCNCRGVYESKRNLTDEQIERIARRGGVIGLVMYNGFITGAGKTSLADLTKHARHIAKITDGFGAIAIGSDLDGGFGREDAPKEIDRYSDIVKFEGFLREAGITEEQIEAIKYKNWLRFLIEFL